MNGELLWGASHDEGYQLPPVADPEAYREQKDRIQRDRTYSTERTLPGGYMSFLSATSRRLYVEPVAPKKRQLMRRKRGVPKYPRA